MVNSCLITLLFLSFLLVTYSSSLSLDFDFFWALHGSLVAVAAPSLSTCHMNMFTQELVALSQVSGIFHQIECLL